MPGKDNSPAHAKAVTTVQEGLRQLSQGLRHLTREILREAESVARGPHRPPSPGRRVHGQYIGLIRNMAAKDKAKVRALHAKKGVEAAIKMARELRGTAK